MELCRAFAWNSAAWGAAAAWGWQVDATVSAARGKFLAAAQPAGPRLSAAAGLVARWATRRLFLDGQVDGVGRCLCLGLRLCGKPVRLVADLGSRRGQCARGVPWGRTRLWIDIRAVRWLREQSVEIDPVGNWQVGDGEVAILEFPGAIASATFLNETNLGKVHHP